MNEKVDGRMKGRDGEMMKLFGGVRYESAVVVPGDFNHEVLCALRQLLCHHSWRRSVWVVDGWGRNTIQYNLRQYNTIQSKAIQYNTIQILL